MRSVIQEDRLSNGHFFYEYKATPSFARFPQGSVKFLLSTLLLRYLSYIHCGGAMWYQWLDTVEFLSIEANLSILTHEIRQSN